MLKIQRRFQLLALSHRRRKLKTRPVGGTRNVFPNSSHLPAFSRGIRIRARRKDTAL